MSWPDLTLPGAIRHSRLVSAQGGPLPGFVAAAAAVSLIVWAIAEAVAQGDALQVAAPVLLFMAIAAVAGQRLWTQYPHRRLGACNLVTLFRSGLVAILVIPLLNPAESSGWGIFAVALVAFLLDGIDGWLARRAGLQSAFGARFDMEVDAVFAALLALNALSGGQAGWWVLGLGFMRYGFVVAGWALPWLRGDLPERFRRKVVCVVQIGTLIALLAPVVQPPLSAALAAGALAVLIWSFALDVIWLWRAREARG